MIQNNDHGRRSRETTMTKHQLDRLSRLTSTSKLTKTQLEKLSRLGCPTCGNHEAAHVGPCWECAYWENEVLVCEDCVDKHVILLHGAVRNHR